MERLEKAGFDPFNTSLDPQQARRIVQDACAGGDDGELFLERRQSQSLMFDDQRMRNAAYQVDEGFGLRAVIGETAGYAHSTDITEAALQRAAESTRFALGNGGGQMAAAPAETGRQKLYAETDPDGEADFAHKTALLQSIDSYARGKDSRVIQVSASLVTSLQEVIILRPCGLLASDRRPMVRLNVSVIVEDNGTRHSGSAGRGGRHMLEPLLVSEIWQGLVDEALRIALVGLRAEPAPAGVFDVVLGPGWPGILLHEAIGHGLEGDFNRKGTSAFAGLMGTRIAAPGVDVVDDAMLPERRGSIEIDDEGTPGQTTLLIEDGLLVGNLQDRQNARLTGVESTGNGRRQSFAHAPMPRMTNTFMRNGTEKPAAMLADLRDGIYAVGFGGGQVDITNGKFVFSCTEAYRVRNGRIGSPVKNATLIGDGATALQKIKAIGDDLDLDPGIGQCGKNGQWVPVGVGLPSLYISGLTIGGQAT